MMEGGIDRGGGVVTVHGGGVQPKSQDGARRGTYLSRPRRYSTFF